VPETKLERTPEEQEECFKDFRAFMTHYEETFNEEAHPIWFLDSCKEDEASH
jgi:hypothetical protein